MQALPHAEMAGAGAAGGPAEALTIAECKAALCTTLNLASADLTSVPEGIADLRHMTSLNISDNPIKQLPATSSSYPPKLAELTMAGCRLSSLPDCLASLGELKKLHAGANSISNAQVVFKCPALQHANLSFNRLSAGSLSSCLSDCPIISLDLSHNDLADLAQTLGLLQQMPALRILSLTGNPFCLLPQYNTAVRSALKSLKFFDGTKLDVLSAPGSRASTAPQHDVSASVAMLADTSVDTLLRLDFTGLAPEDPFKELRAIYQQPAAADAAGTGSAAAGAAPSASPVEVQPQASRLPLQPFGYHIEFADVDGTQYGSVPLVIQPPTRPVTADPKAKTKASPGKAEKVEAELAPMLARGCSSVTLGIKASTAWRDWLRKGIEVKFIQTKHTAVERPPTESELAEAAAVTNGTKAKGKADVPETPPPVTFDVVTTQDVLGTATIRCSPLVSGHAAIFETTAEFLPIPALWDEGGVRMGLEDARHSKKPTGEMKVRLILHAQGLEQAP